MGEQLGVHSLQADGEELVWLLWWVVAPLRGARITFKDQAFPGGYLKLGNVQGVGRREAVQQPNWGRREEQNRWEGEAKEGWKAVHIHQ